MPDKRSKDDVIRGLTWRDINDWAGSGVVSRGRSYQRDHLVQELARTPAGGVVAWVLGTHRYSTSVDVEGEGLISSCTCPYAGTCKHAVAVVLDFLEHLKKGAEVPAVTGLDERLSLLREVVEGDTLDAWHENAAAMRRSEEAALEARRAYLEGQTKSQLVSLIEELAGRHPDVMGALEHRRDLSSATVPGLVRSVREEIDMLSSEPGWTDSWSGEGYIPDYSRVRDRLDALLVQGCADEVVDLGQELLEAGERQVEMSHDEGETAGEIAECMGVVFKALPRSSLSPADQLLWAVDAELADGYDLCEGSGVFWELESTPEVWNPVAEELTRRLDEFESTDSEEGFATDYRRDRLSDWVIVALQKAGRADEVIPLCEREATETGNYVRLVGYLSDSNRLGEAAQWVRRGIAATGEQSPGIAGRLRDSLREIREDEDDWHAVAALRASEFFEAPSLSAFTALRSASQKADAWPQVRSGAMHYLVTGETPRFSDGVLDDKAQTRWPLPDTGLAQIPTGRPREYPVIGTLIDIAIAIAEERPDEVLYWHDRRGQPPTRWGWAGGSEDKIAEAVADTHPDRAIAIWKELSQRQVAQTQTQAYQVAEGYLLKMHRVLGDLGREEEWRAYLTELRQTNVRKRRLVEILDGLAGRPILEGL